MKRQVYAQRDWPTFQPQIGSTTTLPRALRFGAVYSAAAPNICTLVI